MGHNSNVVADACLLAKAFGVLSGTSVATVGACLSRVEQDRRSSFVIFATANPSLWRIERKIASPARTRDISDHFNHCLPSILFWPSRSRRSAVGLARYSLLFGRPTKGGSLIGQRIRQILSAFNGRFFSLNSR